MLRTLAPQKDQPADIHRHMTAAPFGFAPMKYSSSTAYRLTSAEFKMAAPRPPTVM